MLAAIGKTDEAEVHYRQSLDAYQDAKARGLGPLEATQEVLRRPLQGVDGCCRAQHDARGADPVLPTESNTASYRVKTTMSWNLRLLENIIPPLPGPLPARMLNEYAYCPRLAYLEWVQGEWADSADTVDGKFQHRRVNQEPKRKNPEASEQSTVAIEKFHARSVHLTSERLGLTRKDRSC